MPPGRLWGGGTGANPPSRGDIPRLACRAQRHDVGPWTPRSPSRRGRVKSPSPLAAGYIVLPPGFPSFTRWRPA